MVIITERSAPEVFAVAFTVTDPDPEADPGDTVNQLAELVAVQSQSDVITTDLADAEYENNSDSLSMLSTGAG